MTLEDTLASLAARRAAFKAFSEDLEEEIRELRRSRTQGEKDAIKQLVLQGAAEGATMGQLKRSYGTTDHRTISDIVRNHSAEIEAIRRGQVKAVASQPEWFSIGNAGEGPVVVTVGEDRAEYSVVEMEDGNFMFATDTPLWDPTYTVKNLAVERLDGKTEADSADARIVAKFIRQQK